jgi:hypothetical protein
MAKVNAVETNLDAWLGSWAPAPSAPVKFASRPRPERDPAIEERLRQCVLPGCGPEDSYEDVFMSPRGRLLQAESTQGWCRRCGLRLDRDQMDDYCGACDLRVNGRL